MLGTRETTTKKISGWNWGSTHKFKVPKTSLKIVFLESKLQFLEISEYPPILKETGFVVRHIETEVGVSQNSDHDFETMRTAG